MMQARDNNVGSVLISVVTVVYNRAHEIEGTIQSVKRQTYRDIEYIVIDGASTDGTVERIKENSSAITYWVSEPDHGIYDAMNKGLKLCHGEWVYFLNCGDEFFDEDVVQRIVVQLLKTEFSVLAGKVLTTGEGSGLLYPVSSRMHDDSARTLFSSSFCHQAMFVRRKAYLSAGGFNKDFRTFADFDVIHKIIQQTGGFENSETTIARYDLSGVSNNWRYTLRHFEESERLFAMHGERSSRLRYTLRYMRACVFFFRKSIFNFFRR